jgi:hypothetical protein
VGSRAIGDQHHFVVSVQPLCLLFRVLYKKSKGSLGYVRQQQGNQLSGGGCKGGIQIQKRVPQLYSAHRAVVFGCLPFFALHSGAASHLIFKINALAVVLLYRRKDFFKVPLPGHVFVLVHGPGGFAFHLWPTEHIADAATV